METTLRDKLNQLDPESRRIIEEKTEELIEEQMSLRDLRRAHKLSQERVAKKLKIGQEGISRLEKRSDLLISTLSKYVGAMGGKLRLVAEFPNRPPVEINGLLDLSPNPELDKALEEVESNTRKVSAK